MIIIVSMTIFALDGNPAIFYAMVLYLVDISLSLQSDFLFAKNCFMHVGQWLWLSWYSGCF